jgi:hypothetical protein
MANDPKNPSIGEQIGAVAAVVPALAGAGLTYAGARLLQYSPDEAGSAAGQVGKTIVDGAAAAGGFVEKVVTHPATTKTFVAATTAHTLYHIGKDIKEARDKRRTS